MPRYSYKCQECTLEFDAFHSFSESAICPECSSLLCKRIPSVGFVVFGASDTTANKKQKVGQKVNDLIKEAKEELKEQRKTLEENR